MRKVLVLSIAYQPLAVVGWKDAVDMLLRERAEEVPGCGHYPIKTPRDVYCLPNIVRLKHKLNIRNAGGVRPWTRQGVLFRDGHTCAYCGVFSDNGQGPKPNEFTVDHIQPVSRGGESTWKNTVCSCLACNNEKADRTPEEWGTPLRFKPVVPIRGVMRLNPHGHMPEEWKPYVPNTD